MPTGTPCSCPQGNRQPVSVAGQTGPQTRSPEPASLPGSHVELTACPPWLGSPGLGAVLGTLLMGRRQDGQGAYGGAMPRLGVALHTQNHRQPLHRTVSGVPGARVGLSTALLRTLGLPPPRTSTPDCGRLSGPWFSHSPKSPGSPQTVIGGHACAYGHSRTGASGRSGPQGPYAHTSSGQTSAQQAITGDPRPRLSGCRGWSEAHDLTLHPQSLP